MFHLDRTERDLVTRVHRWARSNGWTYDATTFESVTDYRWRGPEYSVVIRVDGTWSTPWTVEVDGPALQTLNAECVSVGQTVNVLVAFGVLPLRFYILGHAGQTRLDPSGFRGAKRAAVQFLDRINPDLDGPVDRERVLTEAAEPAIYAGLLVSLKRTDGTDGGDPGWTSTPGGYVVPADLDDDPALWTGEQQSGGDQR